MSFRTRLLAAATFVLIAVAATWAQSPQTRTDEYTRYELLPPDTSSVKMTYEVSATTEGARTFADAIAAGARVSDVAVTDMMTGEPLKFVLAATAITITLARPVPPKGQGRIRIEKTVTTPRPTAQQATSASFTVPLGAGRHDLVLPAGYELIGCNIPVRVLAEDDGRTKLDLMNVAPGNVTLVVKIRAGALTGDAAKPKPLTNNRSWEPPPAQGADRTSAARRARAPRSRHRLFPAGAVDQLVLPVPRLHGVAARHRQVHQRRAHRQPVVESVGATFSIPERC